MVIIFLPGNSDFIGYTEPSRRLLVIYRAAILSRTQGKGKGVGGCGGESGSVSLILITSNREIDYRLDCSDVREQRRGTMRFLATVPFLFSFMDTGRRFLGDDEGRLNPPP